MNIKEKEKSESGFTLVEMAIVIMIGGILLAFMGSALLSYMKKNRIVTTEHRINVVKESIVQYLSVNGRYPCAARRNVNAAHVNFGREISTDCNAAGVVAGTVRVAVAAPVGAVRIGALPTRTLNLPDEYAIDGWGKRFTYAVTEDQATNLLYQADGGVISVVDRSGNSLVTPVNTAHFVIVSHGTTGMGGYTLGGNLSIPCAGASYDKENCDDDNIFRSTLVNSAANTANFFDDYLFFKGQSVAQLAIPAGAIVSFNAGVCPAGWTAYTNADGRFVVGSTLALGSEQNYFLTGAAGNYTPNLAVGTVAAQDDASMFPPYVALRYCQKL